MPQPKTDTNPSGAGLTKGATVQRLDPVKRIQALAMWRDLTNGMTVAEVAEKFRVSTDLVRRRLSYADRANLLTHHEDVVLKTMVPLAENALIEHLIMGDKEVALKVYEGTGLLRKGGKSPASIEAGKGGTEDSLESHIAKLRQVHNLEPAPPPVDAQILSALDPLAGFLPPPTEDPNEQPHREESGATDRVQE